MQRINNYLVRHAQASIGSLGQLSRAPFASFMTALVIGITLALPTALFIALKNLESLSTNLQQTVQLTLYLKKDVKATEAKQITGRLQSNPQIHSANIISPAQALKELQEQAGFAGTFQELQNNPLPWTIVIQPHSNDHLENLSQELQQIPQVESVQLDMLWVKRLANLMSFAHRAVYTFTLFLSIAVLIIVNNSIRSATQQNQKEIEIIKLIGGTHAFIRRPFLYAGMIYGLLGGIIAWQIVDIIMLVIKSPLQQLVSLYDAEFQLIGLGFTNTLILLGSSIILGLLGSWFAATRYLKIC